MTTFSETTVTCGACGHNFQHSDLSSTNRFGPMDLDTRPPEMARSTMLAWVQQCPTCGHCARDASQFDSKLRGILESQDYQQHLKNETLPPLAARFICSGLLLEAGGKIVEAGLEYLRVAWIMDDAEAAAGSKQWRGQAANCLARSLEVSATPAGSDANVGTIMVDCLRRAGRGQEALSVIERILSGNVGAVIEQVLIFQRELITRGDIRSHTIDEAIKQEN